MMQSGPRPLRLLVIEDNDADAALIIDHLKRAGFEPTWARAETEAEFLEALDPELDVILADFNLPGFSAMRALELLNARGLDVPVIVVSGSIGEETAVELLRMGAWDYLLKDRLARLGSAVRRIVTERMLQLEKRRTEEALREAEDRTRFALRAARVGVWEFDFRTGVSRWSETLEAMHGLPPGSFGGTFEAFLECIHVEDREGVRAAVEEATRDHTESNVLYRTEWPDGSMHWIAGIGKTLYDETGAPLRVAGIGLDVTERHRLEEQHRQSQRVEAIGQLAGGIAHDFNNLLTAIRGYAELVSEALGPASPLQSDMSEIQRAAERAASLTQQILAFSRRQILEPRVLDLRDSLGNMESMLRRLIGENVDVIFRMTDEAARVRADPGQLEQVILNLAINARDAMPSGGSMVLDVANTALDESYARRHVGVTPGQYVMLAVSDTGHGMDAETQARIFEPFFTTKKTEGGTGLGLSTVYGIVKQSGGNIWVYSEVGRGTTFKVYLPRVDEIEARPQTMSSPIVLTGSETILVIEDERGVRELARRVLEQYGYRVLTAGTPEDALSISDHHAGQIQLVLSDVVLPGMSGTALANRIVAGRPDVRVLYMSGYTDSAIRHNGTLGPEPAFLQKPFTPQALARKVREVLG